jgi:outer membrane protein assembly factor BamA
VVTGTEPAFPPDSIMPHLPLERGDTFRLPAFVASADTVGRALRTLGHAYAQVLRNYAVDTAANRAVAGLEAVPGPRVEVDTIIVTGAENLGTAGTRRQLTFREGDVLRRSNLLDSQRNLYSLELVQFASVTIAPDSLQRIPGDSTQATVLVSIAEAPVHQIDAAVGYGTVECARAEARWVNRSFGGGARRLQLSGSVSKIGVALQSVENSVCGAFQGDTLIAAGLDYRFTATVTQPYFLSPFNRITATLYADRVSEPLVYQREAEGGQLSIARRLGENTVVSQDVAIVRAETQASPALYCVAFQVCEPATIASLTRSRWINTIGVSFATDQTDFPLDPTRGYRFNSGFAWAAPLVGSDVHYLRLTGDGSLVRTLKPGWVGAAALRIGNFFSTASLNPERNFLPPEERFYAGGQSSVRGFTRNALGPGLYVTSELTEEDEPDTTKAKFIPVGGTSLTVASVEVRFPSPFLPTLVRLAGFVDAGNVGFGNFWDLERGSWRVTPGFGLRLATPVGPVRLDVGYNPHGPRPEPLYYADPDAGTLIQIRETFTPPAPSFWDRLRVHLAVGQAF